MSAESSADPDKIANKSFATGFRGYDQGEVRAYLTSLASELRKTRAEQDELLLRLAVAEEKTKTAEELDPQELTVLVGEETARVLATARASATEMRTKAEQSANRMLHEADEEATAARESADRYAVETREQADTASRTMRADADAYATDVRTRADEEAFRTQSEAESYALEARAEADEAAAQSRADADAYATRVREEADADAERTRTEATTEIDTLRVAAEADAERMRTEAAEVLGERTAEAEEAAAAIRSEAEAIREQAVADAAAEVDQGRQEGERLVAEAQLQQEEAIKEIGRRRRQARQQLEQVSAARERLLEAYAAVRSLADDATRELDIALPEARAAAEAVVLRDPIDEDEPAAGGEASPPQSTGETASEAAEESGESELSTETEDVDVPEAEADAEGTTDDDTNADVDALFARLRAGSDTDDQAPTEPPTGNGADHADAMEPVSNGRNGRSGNGSAPARPAEPGVSPPVDADRRATLLEQRDDAVEEAEQALARRLKRTLSDEQNDILDRVRRAKSPSFDKLLPDPDRHRTPYLDVAVEELSAAADAGHQFYLAVDTSPGTGSTIVVRTAVDDLAKDLADDLVRQLRSRIETCFSETGDEFELTDRVRACYREWKSQRIAEAARHAAFAAFNRGLYDAAPAGARSCWIVDNGGTPCPDADDNALAGAVSKGEPFPTGHAYPPAHAGCRCLAAPVIEPA